MKLPFSDRGTGGAIALASATVVAALALAAVAAGAGGTAVTKTVTVPPKDFAAARAKCPAGTPAFGGLVADLRSEGGAVPTGMSAAGAAWRSGAANPSTGAHKITAIAYCRDHPVYSVRTKSKLAQPETVRTVTATCPPGTQVLAGGFRGQMDPLDRDPTVLVTGMRRSGERSLAVTVVNASTPEAGTVTAIAYCGKGDRPTARTDGAAVPGRGAAAAKATCPRGSSLVFGGFVGSAKVTGSSATTKGVVPGRLRRLGRSWEALGVNGTNNPSRITSIAYCG